MYKYLMTQRPAMPGAIPNNPRPVDIINYDNRTWLEEYNKNVWSILIYDTPLTMQQINDYELCEVA